MGNGECEIADSIHSNGNGNGNGASASYKRPEYADVDKSKFFSFIPLASLSLRICTYPANVIKTILQAGDGKLSTWQCGKNLWRENGFRSLYRGFAVSVWHVAVGPFYMAAFEVHHNQNILNHKLVKLVNY